MIALYNLIRVDTFHDDINREGCFDTQDMDGNSLNYRIVFASKLPNGATSLEDCLDSERTLNDDVEVINIGDDGLIALSWNKGINADRYITSATSSITVDFGDINMTVRAVFLVDNNSGYVMAYNIQNKDLTLNKDQVVFPLTGLLWSIHNGVEK